MKVMQLKLSPVGAISIEKVLIATVSLSIVLISFFQGAKEITRSAVAERATPSFLLYLQSRKR